VFCVRTEEEVDFGSCQQLTEFVGRWKALVQPESIDKQLRV
jgi:hypothetical protein